MSDIAANKTIILNLTGGLGNQLFQVAAGLSEFPNSKIELHCNLGAPRTNSSSQVDLSEYKISNLVEFAPTRRKSLFVSKVFGYNIRSSKHPRKWEKINLFQKLVRMSTGIIFSAYFGTKGKVVTERNLDSIKDHARSRNYFLIGYFQNSKWVDPVRKNLIRELTLKQPSSRYQEIATQAPESLVVVHVRRGDYRNEPNFGLLGVNYYESAIEDLFQSDPFSQMWLFSDEPEDALLMINSISRGRFQVVSIPVDGLSSAETLELMRLGKNYIIGNSTFSWWGAFLSKNPNGSVIAPSPWFKYAPEDFSMRVDGWKYKLARYESS